MDAYELWMEQAMARKDPKADRFFEVYFEKQELRSKEKSKRIDETRRFLEIEWKKCTLLCVTSKGMVKGKAYLALFGHVGDWYLFEPNGNGTLLKPNWLNMYCNLFPGKMPQELFGKVVYAKEE